MDLLVTGREAFALASIVTPRNLSGTQHFCFDPECQISLHSQPLTLRSSEKAKLGFSMCPAKVTKSQWDKGNVCSFPEDLHIQKLGSKTQGMQRTWSEL